MFTISKYLTKLVAFVFPYSYVEFTNPVFLGDFSFELCHRVSWVLYLSDELFPQIVLDLIILYENITFSKYNISFRGFSNLYMQILYCLKLQRRQRFFKLCHLRNRLLILFNSKIFNVYINFI